MFRALAIETSARTGSIAVVEGDQVSAEQSFPHGLQNAAEIVVIIAELSKSRNLRAGDYDEVFLSIGPGSFTGLRVGVTVAKAIAMVTGARIRAIPSPEVIVQNLPGGWTDALVVLDAKREQAYLTHFSKGRARAEGAPVLERLEAVLPRLPRPLHLIGEGVPFHRKFVPDHEIADGRIILAEEAAWTPQASVLARIGLSYRERGDGEVSAEALVPTYMRLPEAEEKWRQARG